MATTKSIRQKQQDAYFDKRYPYINYGSQYPRVSRCRKKTYKFSREEKKYQGLFFKPAQSKSSDTIESTRQEAEKTVNVDTPGKSKTIDEFMVNTHSINAKILWCMKVVKSHDSYNSCANFTKILTKMSPDSDIATKISLGKTKC